MPIALQIENLQELIEDAQDAIEDYKAMGAHRDQADTESLLAQAQAKLAKLTKGN